LKIRVENKPVYVRLTESNGSLPPRQLHFLQNSLLGQFIDASETKAKALSRSLAPQDLRPAHL
jgi:hypothetical protein